MEVVVTGRHTEVKERFRQHAEAKMEKVTQLAPRAQRVDVEVSHENNRRQLASCERVEITVRDKGPVVRAEACADDPYAALDLAATKLMERLRRSRDRRKVHHGRRRNESVRQPAAPGLSDEALAGAAAAEPGAPAELEVPTPAVMADSRPPADAVAGADDATDASPVVIREKTHEAVPMTLDQALYEMELVGHDFYLFVDAATGCPSVVYRRRGWDYGVIHLEVQQAGSAAAASSDGAARAGSDAALAAVAGAAAGTR
ncbi:ribosome hibernation-promoting factor, HPF/YfiA family [Kineococcus indalonis]|uniref:ribosome hibernation-promoting factor, HPF/YfiA family n=1 Tax=Kineococcus indalonis TaxID=2696566 RepID=UPI0014127949|nr:ribosome-associated translation inhibitor RaiA [Kineococcus indalonis]NAZ88610.1 ribosome-associated translation inhibitor RaiA [Kineococcus indalonis]